MTESDEQFARDALYRLDRQGKRDTTPTQMDRIEQKLDWLIQAMKNGAENAPDMPA